MNTNLNQKLLQLQSEVRALAKNADAYGYQYVTGSKLLFFIRPRMDKLGLRLVPTTISIEQQIIETVPADAAKNKPAKREVLVLLHKQFTWIDVESGESETTDFFSQGCNGWDKSVGSAETYAERYFLLKYFHIATDEDDVDAIHNDNTQEGKKSPQSPSIASGVTNPKGDTERPLEGTKISAAPISLDEAIKMVESATSREELESIWKDYKNMFGDEAMFIKAIASSPFNPKKRG